MSLKSKEKSVADTGADEHLVALPNRSGRRKSISQVHKKTPSIRDNARSYANRGKFACRGRCGWELRCATDGQKADHSSPRRRRWARLRKFRQTGSLRSPPERAGPSGAFFLRMSGRNSYMTSMTARRGFGKRVLLKCCQSAATKRQKPLHHGGAET